MYLVGKSCPNFESSQVRKYHFKELFVWIISFLGKLFVWKISLFDELFVWIISFLSELSTQKQTTNSLICELVVYIITTLSGKIHS